MVSILDAIKSNEEGKVDFKPFVQVLNGQTNDPEDFGLFILKEQADRVNFKPDARWSEYSHTFTSSKEAQQGYISQRPRVVIVRQGQLGMFNRETGRYIMPFHKDRYNNMIHALRTRYLLFLVGEDGSLLHEEPLQFTGKNTFGAAFGTTLKKYRDDFCKTIGQKRRGEFWLNTVFDFEIYPESKGQVQKKTVAGVSRYVVPNAKNLDKLWLGENEVVMAKLKEVYEAEKDFGAFTNKDNDNSGDFEEAPTKEKPPVRSAVATNWLERIKADVSGIVMDEEEKEARDSIYPPY